MRPLQVSEMPARPLAGDDRRIAVDARQLRQRGLRFLCERHSPADGLGIAKTEFDGIQVDIPKAVYRLCYRPALNGRGDSSSGSAQQANSFKVRCRTRPQGVPPNPLPARKSEASQPILLPGRTMPTREGPHAPPQSIPQTIP